MILLYVDDDPDDILLFDDALKLIGSTYSFIPAANGEEALSILNDVTPDIVFLDVNMPIMNGQKTLEAIRSDPRLNSIPVCMLSTTSNKDEVKIFKKLGAIEFIVKQNSFNRFCDALSEFLNSAVVYKNSNS